MVFSCKKKEQILIFGTGSGGMDFYKNCRSRYQVIGFLDNNKQKHGHKLFGQRIYSPQSLTNMPFDKIIIASDYYIEIYAQLTSQLGVDERRIEVFHASQLVYLSWWRQFKRAIEQHCLTIMCHRAGWISSLLFLLLYGQWRGNGNTKIIPFDWLDTQSGYQVHVFRDAMPGVVVGPAYIGRPQAIAHIMLPKVALYRFTDGQICSVSRSVILPEQRLLIERVEPADMANADYSCAHLLFHGKELALVRQETPEYIERGILISGCSETNYYHWFMEVLSQLQFVSEIPAEYDGYPILISVSSQKISAVKNFIDAANIEREFIYLENVTSYLVGDLLLVNSPNNLVPNLKGAAWSDVTNSYLRKESVDYLRRVAFRMCQHPKLNELPKRIFMARKSFIRNYNQSEIMAALCEFGFSCVYLEDLNFCDQVSLIANADVIVGPTGAAWTNLIFAKPGAKALCWMAEEWGNLSCFSNIAEVSGVKMTYFSYQAGTKNSRELYYLGYEIPVSDVVDWVRCL